MKWSVVGLVIAGVVASLCAALLVASVRSGNRGRAVPAAAKEVSIMVAARDLAGTSVVESDYVTKKTLPSDQVLEGQLSDPTQVVGKVLAVPMVAGQPFTKRCFASEGTGVHLASAIPKGMRAVSVSLTNYGGLQGIIYPGSVVDVLVSFRTASEDSSRGELISMTLLQAMQVLAVEARTVTSADGGGSSTSQRNRRLMVTLMLRPEQAEALQLAMEHGTISLALRNPLDAAPVADRPTGLSELSRSWVSQSARRAQRLAAEAASQRKPGTQPGSAALGLQWETVIIRGREAEKCFLPLPGDYELGQPARKE